MRMLLGALLALWIWACAAVVQPPAWSGAFTGCAGWAPAGEGTLAPTVPGSQGASGASWTPADVSPALPGSPPAPTTLESSVVNLSGPEVLGNPALTPRPPSEAVPPSVAMAEPGQASDPPASEIAQPSGEVLQETPPSPPLREGRGSLRERWARMRYEANRGALQLLLTAGVGLSLSPASPTLEKSLLGEVSNLPIRLVFLDWDDTVEEFASPASPETAKLLSALQKAGRQLVILTDRPDQPEEGSKSVTILESLSPLAPEERSGILVASRRGARILEFDEEGELQLLHETPGLDLSQREAIRRAADVVKERWRFEYDNLGPYSYALVLKTGTPEVEVRRAARFMTKHLRARGFDFEIQPRMAKDPKNPPYITLSTLDKSVGVRKVTTLLGISDPRKMLILGDSFFTPTYWDFLLKRLRGVLAWMGLPLKGNSVDEPMARALPGVLAFSVGGTGNPALQRLYVTAEKGPAATRKILRQLLKGGPVSQP